MYFNDRNDAGAQLATRLTAYAGQDAIVLALPRGGVPVAAQIAKRLGLPLDLLVVRKIGIPWQPEVAMGAVIDGERPVLVRNEDVLRHGNITEADFEAVAERELSEIEGRKTAYLGERAMADVKGRTAIVVDDGVATGATIKAALRGHPDVAERICDRRCAARSVQGSERLPKVFSDYKRRLRFQAAGEAAGILSFP